MFWTALMNYGVNCYSTRWRTTMNIDRVVRTFVVFFDSKSGRSTALISDLSCTAEEGSRNDWVLAGENYWPKEKC